MKLSREEVVNALWCMPPVAFILLCLIGLAISKQNDAGRINPKYDTVFTPEVHANGTIDMHQIYLPRK